MQYTQRHCQIRVGSVRSDPGIPASFAFGPALVHVHEPGPVLAPGPVLVLVQRHALNTLSASAPHIERVVVAGLEFDKGNYTWAEP